MENDKRRSRRFESDVSIKYRMIYDLDTKINYKSMSDALRNGQATQYLAQSRDVSLEGLSFVSEHSLACGDLIDMDVFIPTSEESIHMEGEVRWSFKLSEKNGETYKTGIKLLTVKGESVAASIHFDEQYKLEWSNALDIILGEFSKISQKRHDDPKEQ